MEELLRELIEFVQSASPLVWEALVKQVYVAAFRDGVWGVIFLTTGFYLLRFVKYCRAKDNESNSSATDMDYKDMADMSYVCMIAAFVVATALLLGVFGKLVNPDFYAIKMILAEIRQ